MFEASRNRTELEIQFDKWKELNQQKKSLEVSLASTTPTERIRVTKALEEVSSQINEADNRMAELEELVHHPAGWIEKDFRIRNHFLSILRFPQTIMHTFLPLDVSLLTPLYRVAADIFYLPQYSKPSATTQILDKFIPELVKAWTTYIDWCGANCYIDLCEDTLVHQLRYREVTTAIKDLLSFAPIEVKSAVEANERSIIKTWEMLLDFCELNILYVHEFGQDGMNLTVIGRDPVRRQDLWQKINHLSRQVNLISVHSGNLLTQCTEIILGQYNGKIGR